MGVSTLANFVEIEASFGGDAGGFVDGVKLTVGTELRFEVVEGIKSFRERFGKWGQVRHLVLLCIKLTDGWQ